ncbi:MULTISPECIES: hypothetical protein [Streptomyces]|uniref:Integral membrane protein n=1 Tax=Streptomyces solicathayae TaxID=3081768 RepID=A0ABZ0LWK3_9ACTN|nr:hypothetical protein [Streptomyces sp. HUAS YS2]WOX23792.1 hypothetical protein R2D22_21365 [Streptomyces sp. HUAS YS2]
MIRNIVGSVLALAGATAAVWSPFRAWYDGRHGSDYPIEDLFGGITDVRAEVIGSMLLPFAFAALVTLIGVVLRSRLLVALAGLIVLGFSVLWMVRVGQFEGSLTVSGDGTGLGIGVGMAVGGGFLLLLAAVVMSGRHAPHATRLPEPAPTHPTLDGQGHRPEPEPEPYAYPYQPPDPYETPTRTMEAPEPPPGQDPGRHPDQGR